jgi:PST family polysaccharide transporter
LAWTAGAKWATQAFSWVSVVLLARLLTTADYGVGEMAGFFFALTNTLAEFGVGTAVLHMAELDEDALHQLHGFSLLLCTGVYVLTLVASPLIARFFRDPALVPVIALSNLTFFITGFQAVPIGLLQRDMNYKLLSVSEASLSLVQALVSVVLAWFHFGYWALIIGVIAGKTANAALLMYWKPVGFAFPRWKNISAPLAFGRQAAIGNLAVTACLHSDTAIVGRMMGESALGVYRQAVYLASAPAEKISMLIMRTAGPLFANLQSDRAAVRRYFLHLADTLTILVIPAMVGLVMVAPDAVYVILGKKWEPAAKPLVWLACYMIVATLSSLVTQVLTSLRMTKFTMRISLLNLAIMPAAFLVGARLAGTTGVAAAWVIASPLTAIPSTIVLLRRINVGWRDCLATFGPAVSSAIVMALALAGARNLVAQHQFVPAARLAIEIGTGAVAYCAVLLLFFRDKLWRYVRFIRGLRGRKTAGAAAE